MLLELLGNAFTCDVMLCNLDAAGCLLHLSEIILIFAGVEKKNYCYAISTKVSENVPLLCHVDAPQENV